MEIPAYLRHSESKQLLSFASVLTTVAFEQLFTCSSLVLCYFTVPAALSIALQVPKPTCSACGEATQSRRVHTLAWLAVTA